MTKPSYRERLAANAEDFDTIVSEILAENDALKAMPRPTNKQLDLIARTIKVCQEVAGQYMTASPMIIALAELTPEIVLSKLKERK